MPHRRVVERLADVKQQAQEQKGPAIDQEIAEGTSYKLLSRPGSKTVVQKGFLR